MNSRRLFRLLLSVTSARAGWWLVKKADGSVDIVNMGAAGTCRPRATRRLLCVDVWEHAYYIDLPESASEAIETFPE